MSNYQDPVNDVRCAEILEALALGRFPSTLLRSERAAMIRAAQVLRQSNCELCQMNPAKVCTGCYTVGPLRRNCSNCDNWDGDTHCALPQVEKIMSFVRDPQQAVCGKWKPKDGGYGHGV